MKHTRRISTKRTDTSRTMTVACRYWVELADGHWGQLLLTQFPLREASGSFGKLREASGSFGELREAPGSFGKLRQASGSFGKLREASGSFGKLRQMQWGSKGYPSYGAPSRCRWMLHGWRNLRVKRRLRHHSSLDPRPCLHSHQHREQGTAIKQRAEQRADPRVPVRARRQARSLLPAVQKRKQQNPFLSRNILWPGSRSSQGEVPSLQSLQGHGD